MPHRLTVAQSHSAKSKPTLHRHSMLRIRPLWYLGWVRIPSFPRASSSMGSTQDTEGDLTQLKEGLRDHGRTRHDVLRPRNILTWICHEAGEMSPMLTITTHVRRIIRLGESLTGESCCCCRYSSYIRLSLQPRTTCQGTHTHTHSGCKRIKLLSLFTPRILICITQLLNPSRSKEK